MRPFGLIQKWAANAVPSRLLRQEAGFFLTGAAAEILYVRCCCFGEIPVIYQKEISRNSKEGTGHESEDS